MAARRLAPFTIAQVTAMVGDGARALVARGFAMRGVAFDQDGFDAFLQDYTVHSAVLTKPYPGVVEALGRMADAGWQFAVCTNKPEAAARALLDALDLTRWFAEIGGGDSFPSRKPDPRHLLSTLAAAGGEPGRAVMLGDHSNDIQAAMGAGIASIFAGWGYGAPKMGETATATARGFADIPAIASRLLATPDPG